MKCRADGLLKIIGLAFVAGVLAGTSSQLSAHEPSAEPTFAREVLPILQRSCQQCHRPDSVAPFSLLTYEEARPWARAIKYRTGLGPRAGVMPPWYIEKDVGIQAYQDDISLSEEEIATIAAWVDNGTPRGNPADAPPPREFDGPDTWAFGEPDLVVDSPPFTIKAGAPDWWGALPPVPTGLTEDRHVAAVQVKEISSVEGGAGGRFVVHHGANSIIPPSGGFGLSIGGGHEVGRNAEYFLEAASPLMPAGRQLHWNSVHLHSNGEDTTAFLRVGYKFQPKGYKPKYRVAMNIFGTSEIDLRPMMNQQEVHLYKVLEDNMLITTFEPHLHAAGTRECVEAIWQMRRETLGCAGFDQDWVKVYKYADDAAPLLPKGTILHVTAYFDNSPSNRHVADPRNWSGFGHRSIDNMAILIAPGAVLSDEEFQERIADRRKRLQLKPGDVVLGCPLCGLEELPGAGR